MKTKANRSFLYDTPSWIHSILWVFASTIVLFGLGEVAGHGGQERANRVKRTAKGTPGGPA